jgi:hypothetical protein
MASSSAETFPAPSDCTYGVGNIKVEEDVDVIEESFIAINKEEDIGVKKDEIPLKKNPGGGQIFRTRPDRPWGPPSLLYNGYRVFPGGKAAGAWC